MFVGAQKKIDELTLFQADLTSPQAIELKKNARLAILGKLAQLVEQLRQLQSLQNQQSHSISKSPRITLQKFSSPITSQQITLDETSTLLEEREKELESISDRTREIVDLVKSVHLMVIDQGTLLDRIDYNLERTQRYVERGNAQLVKANLRQSQMKKRKMVLLFLIVLIIVLLVGVFSK